MFKTPSLWMPRMPFAPKLAKVTRKPLPVVTSLLAEQPLVKKYPNYPPKKDLEPHLRLSLPKKPKRWLSEVETARPLPQTFSDGMTLKDFKSKPLIPPTECQNYHYPYKYYEICLMRGILGLPKQTRKIVQSLGLHTRHQVVWRLVGSRSAGQILKVKELVSVKLVNDIPPKSVYPRGFQVVESFAK